MMNRYSKFIFLRLFFTIFVLFDLIEIISGANVGKIIVSNPLLAEIKPV